MKRRNKTEKEKKLGHRRVGVGGEITYKKVFRVLTSNTCYTFLSYSLICQVIRQDNAVYYCSIDEQVAASNEWEI